MCRLGSLILVGCLMYASTSQAQRALVFETGKLYGVWDEGEEIEMMFNGQPGLEMLFNTGALGVALIRAGSFVMGSQDGDPDEVPVHKVTLTHDFLIMIHEFNQGALPENARNPSKHKPSRQDEFDTTFSFGSTLPLENVSWLDAIRYANQLSKSFSLPPCYHADGRIIGGGSIYECRGFRLPTEAEWEYAARGRVIDERYGPLNGIAWYGNNSGGSSKAILGKKKNPFGLYDMLGNVWEFCHDWYAPYSGGHQIDPEGPRRGKMRVARGAGWSSAGRDVRAANRHKVTPTGKGGNFGFRLVKTVHKPISTKRREP